MKLVPTPLSESCKIPTLVFAVAVLAVVLRVGLALATHFTQEDFLITLRYAENIAHGHGFVFNVGERVLGTTTPLYTLLLAGITWLGLPAPVIGKALNILSDGLLCLVVYRTLAMQKQETAGICAAFLVAVNPIQMRVSISGMESSLVALCCAVIWLFFIQRRYFAAYIVGAVLFLLRWDGLLLVFVLTAAITVRDRKLPTPELLIYALLCAPWLFFATQYFGSPIPVTLAAKTVVYGWYFRTEHFPLLARLIYRLGGTPLYAAMSIAAGLGAWRAFRGRMVVQIPMVSWFVLYWVSFLVSKVWLFEWYLVPPMFVYEILAALGIAVVAERIGTSWQQSFRYAIALAAAICLAVVNVRDTLVYTQGLQALEDNLRRPLGLWLHSHSRPTDRIMLEPIGYIGYYSHLPVVDMTGLVTPSVLRFYNTKITCPWLNIAYAYQPDWCVLRPSEVALMMSASLAEGQPWAQHYTHVQSFSYVARSGDVPTTFNIYKRNKALSN